MEPASDFIDPCWQWCVVYCRCTTVTTHRVACQPSQPALTHISHPHALHAISQSPINGKTRFTANKNAHKLLLFASSKKINLKNSPPCVLVVIALFAPHSGPLLFSCTRNWHDAINLTHSPYITICSCIVRYRGFCLSRAVTTMYHVATVTSHSFVLLSTIPVFMCKLHPIHHVTTSV